MTWVKLDDQFFTRAKAQRAGKDGRSLYLAGLCFCAANLTDGRITSGDLPFVAASAGVKAAHAKQLVEVGLWETAADGYQVHDYLEYNPTAEEVREQRRKDAERKRAERQRGGRRRPNGVRPDIHPDSGRDTERSPEVPSRPVPSHSPELLTSETQLPSSSSYETPDDDDRIRRVLEDLWPFMAYRRLERRRRSEPIRDLAAYVRTTSSVLASQFAHEARALLRVGRGPGLEELADLLEADEESGVPTSSTITEMRRPDCRTCDNARVVELGDGWAKCPDCVVKASA